MARQFTDEQRSALAYVMGREIMRYATELGHEDLAWLKISRGEPTQYKHNGKATARSFGPSMDFQAIEDHADLLTAIENGDILEATYFVARLKFYVGDFPPEGQD